MTNPFVTKRVNYDLTKAEKEYRKQPDIKWIEANIGNNTCLNSQIKNITSTNSLSSFIGKFNLDLLLQLSAFKAISFSPLNLKDFTEYLDQTISYFSCIFSDNLDNINNKSPKSKVFDFGAFLVSIPFDFLKAYGLGVYSLVEKLALELIKKIFLEVLDIVDCDKINKCILPCDPSDNPYQKLFVKPIIQESTNSSVFFAKKIIDGKFSEKGLNISEKELKEYASKALSNLAPDELECLLKGFKTTAVIQYLINLFKEETGSDINDVVIRTIFDDIQNVVDLIPYTPDVIDNNICGLISLESVARMRLRRQGYSQSDIDTKINFIIQENKEKLNNIVSFLQQLPTIPQNIDNNVNNSPITIFSINNSLDLVFNSINITDNFTKTVLQDLLVNVLGELCLGYYWTNWGNGSIPRRISLPIDIDPDNNQESSEDSSQNSNSSIQIGKFSIDNPLSTSTFSDLLIKINNQIKKNIDFIQNITNAQSFRFFDKYDLGNRNIFEGYTIEYTSIGDILIFQNTELAFSIKDNIFTDYINKDTIEIIYEELYKQYISITNRNNITNIFTEHNSDTLLSVITNELNKESDRIYKDVYENILFDIENYMSKEFFFQELFPLGSNPINKKKFSDTIYFDIDSSLQRIKGKINV